MTDYVDAPRQQPHFANARSIRNAIDRARLGQAMRLFKEDGAIDRDGLMTIEAEDISAKSNLRGLTVERPSARNGEAP